MVQWSAQVCQNLSVRGRLLLGRRDTDHEASDLLQAGVDVTLMQSLGDVARVEASACSSGLTSRRLASYPRRHSPRHGWVEHAGETGYRVDVNS